MKQLSKHRQQSKSSILTTGRDIVRTMYNSTPIGQLTDLAKRLMDNGWHERQQHANRHERNVEVSRIRRLGLEIPISKNGGMIHFGYSEENKYVKH